MPWKECHVMDERLRFVARLLEGETMVALCEEFGISRKTGHKIYQRYRQIGVQGLTDRSRRPHRHANQLPMVVEKTIVQDQAGVSQLGRAEDPGAAPAALARGPLSRDQHGACGPRPPRARDPAVAAITSAPHGDAALLARGPQSPLVRRLQGRVPARQPAVLLSADDHRLRQPLSARVRGALDHQGTLRLHRLRARVSRIRAPRGDSHGQRRALRLRARVVRAEQAGGLVAPPRHRPRADCAGPSRAEWPARAAAPDAEDRGDAPAVHQCPPAAGPLRYLRAPVQPRAAAPGARDGDARQPLSALGARPIRASRSSSIRATTGRR